MRENGAIAQLGERFNGIEEVVGSIPSGSTICKLNRLNAVRSEAPQNVRAGPPGWRPSAFKLLSRGSIWGPAMKMSIRAVAGGAIGLVGLVAGGSGSHADAIDARLFGAWTTSQPDCSKIFVKSRGGLAYRQPVDKFAQAAIIGPREIRLPASTCWVQRVSHEKEVIKITADCNDSISYTTQNVQIRVTSGGEIVYNPTGDPTLDTTLIKCGM